MPPPGHGSGDSHEGHHRSQRSVPRPGSPSRAAAVPVRRVSAPHPHIPAAALEIDDVRAPVSRGPAAFDSQLQARGGQRRTRRPGDQHSQPLHRDEGPDHRGLHRVQVDPVRGRHAGSPLPARRRPRKDERSHRRERSLSLLRPLLPLVLRVQALLLRTQPRPDGVGEGPAVHAAAVRSQEAGEFRRLFLPGRGLLCPGPGRSRSARRVRRRLARDRADQAQEARSAG